MQRPSTIATWNRNPADEEAMGAAHAPIWRRMIDVSVSHDLHESMILDYGCNQGGFLRMLYDRNPFRGAVGIDIARESVARADLLKGHRPIEYKVGDKAAALGRTFDFAFSHEVLYLLPDLAATVNVERFRREIQLAAKLQHPHIVPLLAAGGSADVLFYTMPFVEGEALRTRLAREGELLVR